MKGGQLEGNTRFKLRSCQKKKCMRSMLQNFYKFNRCILCLHLCYVVFRFRLRLRSMFIFRFWFRLLRAYMIWDCYQQEEVKVYRHQGSLLGAEAKWSIESDLVLPPPTMITFIYSSVYSC